MADLLRRDAANLAIAYIRGSVEGSINVPDEYINYGAAAGIGITRTMAAPDPIQYLSAGNPRGAQMTTMIQTYITQCARTLRLVFTRTGTWSLQANPGLANQGQDYLNQQATLPMPGVQTTYYGYVPGFTPIASQLTPSNGTGYSIFTTGQNASRSLVIALLTNLGSRVAAHMTNNPISISYCHTNCHNNCHASRGRR